MPIFCAKKRNTNKQRVRPEADPIETQPDLDLSQDPDEDRRSREARDRLARLRGEPEAAAAVGAMMQQDAEAPRRELLARILKKSIPHYAL